MDVKKDAQIDSNGGGEGQPGCQLFEYCCKGVGWDSLSPPSGAFGGGTVPGHAESALPSIYRVGQECPCGEPCKGVGYWFVYSHPFIQGLVRSVPVGDHAKVWDIGLFIHTHSFRGWSGLSIPATGYKGVGHGLIMHAD